MEPINSWSEERVADWLQGLDAPLQQYTVSDWRLSGLELLQLNSSDLERLGVHKIGHQELILEAVEKLCSLTYCLSGENLRALTEKLRAVAHTLQMGIQSRWQRNSYKGRSATKLPIAVLQVVVELIASAKGLFSLLNRYQVSRLSGQTANRNIFSYCKELGEIVHKEATVYEKEKDIISVCRQLVAVCDEVLTCSPESLLSHSAQLESVDLVPVSPDDQLGIEITSTGSSNHYVTGTAAEPASNVFVNILAGDEVIKVNDQIVVGWSRANLVKKLQENPKGVTLVLKKIPTSVKRRSSSLKATSPEISYQQEEEQRSEEEEGAEEEEEENPRYSIFERVAASVRSLSFRRAVQGPEATPPPTEPEGSEVTSDLEASLTSSQLTALSPPASSDDTSRLSPGLSRGIELPPTPRSPSPFRFSRGSSPVGFGPERSSVSSCPEMVGHTGNKETKKSSTKGTSTAMSRRRVSCRELVKPDCDGWLWKKRKESSVFITQKWQRFWFVLKGSALYWYTSPQDEKAEGFVNIASYSIESAGEHKRKYVFKMRHNRFQDFFFAAENVTDMSKWINCLITAIQKFKKTEMSPDSEEECYSETESESEGSPSPRRRNKKVLANTLPRPKGKTPRMPLPSPTTGGSKGGPVDEMGMMLNNIKEGGVSLTGQEQPFTHDHFRKSFIRRNKNPVINEKAHALRALQSTLKAKEAELQMINKLLEESELTPAKYRHWKQNNEELVQELERLAALRTSKDGGDAAAQDTPPEPVALETAETEGAYKLSLSDGEQAVDAEVSDVLLDIRADSPPGGGGESGPDVASSPVLELSLGSLQESINQQLSEMVESGEVSENYFYI